MPILLTRIVLNKPGNVYLCGERIDGKVKIFVHKECKDRKLIVAWDAAEQGMLCNSRSVI